MEQRISIERLELAVNIFGSFDENIRLLERELHVTVVSRDSELKVTGEGENVMYAVKVIQGLLHNGPCPWTITECKIRFVMSVSHISFSFCSIKYRLLRNNK